MPLCSRPKCRQRLRSVATYFSQQGPGHRCGRRRWRTDLDVEHAGQPHPARHFQTGALRRAMARRPSAPATSHIPPSIASPGRLSGASGHVASRGSANSSNQTSTVPGSGNESGTPKRTAVPHTRLERKRHKQQQQIRRQRQAAHRRAVAALDQVAGAACAHAAVGVMGCDGCAGGRGVGMGPGSLGPGPRTQTRAKATAGLWAEAGSRQPPPKDASP